jgi:hypothetical protein
VLVVGATQCLGGVVFTVFIKKKMGGKQKKANCRLSKWATKTARIDGCTDEWLIFNCVSGCFLRHIFSPAAVSALEPQGCIAARFLFEHHQRTAIFATRRAEVVFQLSILRLPFWKVGHGVQSVALHRER